MKFSATEQSRVVELQKTIEEHDKAWQFELRNAQQKLSDNTIAHTSAIDELQQLKVLKEADFYGEELLTWALDPKSVVKAMPSKVILMMPKNQELSKVSSKDSRIKFQVS